MIGYVTIGVNDIEQSVVFYDAVFKPLDYSRHFKGGGWAGYGLDGKAGGLDVYLATPANGQPATLGNGSMLGFKAKDRAAVDAFYSAALEAGGSDEGPPDVRGTNDPPFYGAYVRDPVGNKLCAFFKG